MWNLFDIVILIFLILSAVEAYSANYWIVASLYGILSLLFCPILSYKIKNILKINNNMFTIIKVIALCFTIYLKFSINTRVFNNYENKTPIVIFIILSLCIVFINHIKLRREITQPSKELTLNVGVNFPNSITREQYSERKAQKEREALASSRFWDELDIDIFNKNIEYCKNNICPYCTEQLPERKGKTYKCPICKNKIYRKKVLNQGEGLFTEDERDIIDKTCIEYENRKSFLDLWRSANEIIPIKLDENKQYNINSAAQQAIILLHRGKPQFYNQENNIELRNCKMLEGKFQRRYGTPQQATNVYMQILYLDLIDDFDRIFFEYASNECSLFDMDNIMQKVHKKFKEKEILIAPAIYGWAFNEDLPLEQFEKIFKFNANSLKEQLKFDVLISPDEAWQKILEYRASLEKAQ